MSDIHDRISALESQLDDLKAAVDESEEIATPSTRRDLIKKVVIGAAGVAAGSALMARPAAALDGSTLLMGLEGGQNEATLGTRANYTGVGTRAAFVFQSGTTYANSDANFPAALAGWAGPSGTVATGVYGYSAKPSGFGVVGYASSSGAIGGVFLGNRAQLTLWPNPALPTGQNYVGDLYQTKVGTTGNLWACVGDGPPSVFRKLAGPDTAGSLHLLAAPVRVYDSRPGNAPIVGGDGALGGSIRTIDLHTGFVGAVATPACPAGATGALISVTLDATTAQGFLAVFSNALPDVGSSNLNWYTTGQILAVTTVSAVDVAAKIKVKAGGGGTTQIVVDVIGYYL